MNPVTPPTPRLLRDLPRLRHEPHIVLAQWVREFGPTVLLPVPRRPILVVGEPGDVEQVLVREHHSFDRATMQYRGLARLVGTGLLTSDGDTWKTRRSVLQPAFRPQRLGAVRESAAGEGAAWASLEGRDVVELCMSSALSVLWGPVLGAAHAPASTEGMVGEVERGLHAVMDVAQRPWGFPAWVPGTGERTVREIRQGLLVSADQVLSCPAAEDGTVLAALREGCASGEVTRQDAADEVLTQIVAGHETVGMALAWALILLATRPQVQAAVRDEVAKFDGSEGRFPGQADAPMLWGVVDETLRLYPPAWLMTRQVVKPVTVAGVALPVGSMVMLSPWVTHRRPEVWPRGGVFDPSAWAGRNPQVDGRYFPFGLGTRLCIGRQVARHEMASVLGAVLSKAQVFRDDEERIGTHAGVTLSPNRRVQVTFRPW